LVPERPECVCAALVDFNHIVTGNCDGWFRSVIVLVTVGIPCDTAIRLDLAGFVPEGPEPVRRPFVDFEYVGSGDGDRWSASAVILERLGCPDHRSVGLDMPRAGPKRSRSREPLRSRRFSQYRH